MTFGSKSPFKRDDDDDDDEDDEDELTSSKSGKYSSGPERPGLGAFVSSNKGNDKGNEKKDPFKSSAPPPANKPAFGSSGSAFGSPRPGTPASSTPVKKDEPPAPKSGGFSFGGNKPPEKKDDTPAKPAGAFGASPPSNPFG